MACAQQMRHISHALVGKAGACFEPVNLAFALSSLLPVLVHWLFGWLA